MSREMFVYNFTMPNLVSVLPLALRYRIWEKRIDMLLAVFKKINFTAFLARKYGIGKLIKMTLVLINNMSKKIHFEKI